MESLGDPRLIARTIIDTQRQQDGYQDQPFYTREEPDRERGFHGEMNEEGGVDIKYRRFNFNTWYGKLLAAAVVILVAALILVIVGGILSWVLPILIPVLLILWLLRMIFGDR